MKKDEANAKGTRTIKNGRPAEGALVHPEAIESNGSLVGAFLTVGTRWKNEAKGNKGATG